MTANPDSSVFYHAGDSNDPFVEDPNRPRHDDDYFACPACTCTEPTNGCGCSCHSQRRHH